MISTLFTNPLVFLISAFSLIVAITIHEFAHAKVADMLGDPTPGLQGRITLNPMAHLDLYGTLMLLFIGFGWGKPVQFDPFNLENPKRDAAIISFAGPLSNIILATICSIFLYSLKIIGVEPTGFISFLIIILSVTISMNLMLAVFNLIPIHPLDGFKIVGGLLNEKQAREWYSMERMGFIFLLILIVPFGGRSMLDLILTPILTFLGNIFIPYF